MELAFWWRRVRVKHFKRTVLRQLIVARKAVNVIKARGAGDSLSLRRSSTAVSLVVLLAPDTNTPHDLPCVFGVLFTLVSWL